MTARTPAPSLGGLVDWLDRDPSRDLAQLYEQATGSVADDLAVRRCGVAVFRMVDVRRPQSRAALLARLRYALGAAA